MNKNQLKIEDAVPRLPEFQFCCPVSWELNQGQQWAVVGPNGAGKSVLIDLLTGKLVLKEGRITSFFAGDDRPLFEKVKEASFRDIYSLADYRNMYYQQRWNSTEEGDPTVWEVIGNVVDKQQVKDLFSLFGITDLLEKRIILLSSGELRKFLIIKMLLSNPRVLILDNPYIGLDASSRNLLNDLFARLSVREDLQLVLVLSNPADIPEMITHILPVKEMECLPPVERLTFLEDESIQSDLFPVWNQQMQLPVQEQDPACYESVLKMCDIHIQYGRRVVLDQLNWEVKKGDKWALLGSNGAGKTTLLSLVCADNPQSYANTFYLFDKKRGTGESIWEIKRRIGYISPEIHLFYLEDQRAVDIVGSGFFDSIGLHRKCSEEQLCWAMEWMKTFRIAHLRDQSFLKLSYGEQRLVILARAFVKNPDLLILDEPLHGLDRSNRQLVRQIIESFCKRVDKTLIYVTHYLQEIPDCVNQRFVLEKRKE